MMDQATIQQKIMQELELSQQILLWNEDITPRFTLFTPEQETVIMMQLSDDVSERYKSLNLVRLMLLHTKATGFMMAAEAIDPSGIVVSLVLPDTQFTGFQVMKNNPLKKPPEHLSFEPIQWIGQVDPVLLDVLGTGQTLSEAEAQVAENLLVQCQVRKEDVRPN